MRGSALMAGGVLCAVLTCPGVLAAQQPTVDIDTDGHGNLSCGAGIRRRWHGSALIARRRSTTTTWTVMPRTGEGTAGAGRRRDSRGRRCAQCEAVSREVVRGGLAPYGGIDSRNIGTPASFTLLERLEELHQRRPLLGREALHRPARPFGLTSVPQHRLHAASVPGRRAGTGCARSPSARGRCPRVAACATRCRSP